MNKGWISLHRKVLESPLLKMGRSYSNFEAFIWLLLHCNYEDKKVLIGNKLYVCKRGSFITSQKKLMLTFNWGVSRLRSYLDLMESDGTMVVESFSTHTYLTILNFDTYQNTESQTNRKQTKSKLRSETTNNTNKDNKEIRTQKFFKTVEGVFNKNYSSYPKKTLEDFCQYWTESNPNGRKLRYEKQPVFDVSRRLRTWINRSNEASGESDLIKKEQLIEKKYQEQQKKLKKANTDVASDEERRKALGLK